MLQSFPNSYNSYNAVMKFMPISVLTPWYVHKSSSESVPYNNIFKNFDIGIYRPTSLHVPSRLPRVGIVYVKLPKDCQIFGFNFYSVI